MEEAALNKEEIGFDSMIIGDNHNFPCEKKVVTNLEDESSPSFFFLLQYGARLELTVCLGEGFGASIWDGARIWGENFSIFTWDLLLGFVTPKSQLKIPSKHMEFHKFTSARFSFCRRRGNQDYLFPTFTFLYFSLSHFFLLFISSQIWLCLSPYSPSSDSG